MTVRFWNNEKIVNTTIAGNQFATVVTGLTGGGYVVAWLDASSGPDIAKYQIFDAWGVRLGTDSTILFDVVGDYSDPQVTALADGGFVIGVVNQDFGSQTGSFTQSFRSNPSGIFTTADLGIFDVDTHLNSLTAVGTGYMQSVTHTNHTNALNYDSYIRNFDSSGALVSTGTLSENPIDNESEVDLATNRVTGKVVAVYTRADAAFVTHQIYLKFADATNSTFIDAPIFVAGNIGENFVDAHVTWVGSDRVAVVCRDASTDRLFYRVFDAAGVGLFSAFIDSGLPNGYSKIVDLKNGTFAIVYMQSDVTDDVVVRQYDRNGSQIGAEVVVNTNSQHNEVPDVAALADGRLVVTWTHDGGAGDGNGTTILQQILDPRDGIVNGSSNSETLLGNDLLGDQIRGFAGADSLYGLNGSDALYGGDGIDTLDGGRGDDLLFGGTGNDTLIGGVGGDDIVGESGIDLVSFAKSKAGVNVNFLTGEGTGGDAEGDTYASVESFGGSNFADIFVGANSASASIYGFAGADTLTGGSGNDSFFSGAGADLVDGLGGVDIALYTGSTAVTVNLATNFNIGGDALFDSLTNIEDVSGSAFDDSLTGNALSNRLYGQNGNDRIEGGKALDTLVGGAGSDSFVFNLGDSGQTATTLDIILDYATGAVGVGDEIDFASALSIGGTTAAATAAQAAINAITGVATFAAGSGTTLADALNDIGVSMTTGGNAVGEFALFRVNNTGVNYMFISDGVAGVGVNDVLVRMPTFSFGAVTNISIDAGDVTILG